MKKVLQSNLFLSLKSFGIIMILLFIITIFSYFNLLPSKITNYIILFIPLITIIYTGIKIGKNTTSKGYLGGVLNGLVYILIFWLLSVITANNLTVKSVIYYIIMLVISIIGSIVGINKKKTT